MPSHASPALLNKLLAALTERDMPVVAVSMMGFLCLQRLSRHVQQG